ncbi:S-adenosyl-L-methionine-dependent methyltransferase [Xylaria flabelliformis]|nr:S-adenosyl-L-methionine-dependent methyltransferase [Xylaria flabelliformis]
MAKPAHLEPSKLGTKEYWDALYTTEIANHAHDPTDTGTAWFDDSDAEAKLVEFLEDPEFRAQELGLDESTTSFLDLGTGNGALLFALRDAGWQGPMLGVDYSEQSVRFARRIEKARRRRQDDDDGNVHFARHDILHGSATALLDARFSPSVANGWDVVLDKGTFDAISLSAETLDNADADGGPRRINEAYGARVLPLVREGGLFLITSCNWTEAELRSWFEEGGSAVQEMPPSSSTTVNGGNREREFWGFEVVGRVEYRSFSFGGVKGQTISSLCFRKVKKSR